MSTLEWTIWVEGASLLGSEQDLDDCIPFTSVCKGPMGHGKVRAYF